MAQYLDPNGNRCGKTTALHADGQLKAGYKFAPVMQSGESIGSDALYWDASPQYATGQHAVRYFNDAGAPLALDAMQADVAATRRQSMAAKSLAYQTDTAPTETPAAMPLAATRAAALSAIANQYKGG